MPPPKSANYKPVPPPKPKNYRPPPTESQNQWGPRLGADGNYDQRSPQRSIDTGISSSPMSTLRNDDNANVPTLMKSGTGNNYQHSKSYSTAGNIDSANFTPHQNGSKSIIQYIYIWYSL